MRLRVKMNKRGTCGTLQGMPNKVSHVSQVSQIKSRKERPIFWSSKLYQKNSFLETCPAESYHKCDTYEKDVTH